MYVARSAVLVKAKVSVEANPHFFFCYSHGIKSSGAVGNLTYEWYMCIRSCKYTALFKTVGWIASELEIFMVKTTSILVTLMNRVDSTKLFCKILDIYN